MIESFRRWLGIAFLNGKRAEHRAGLGSRHGIATALLREKQPLMDAFDFYDRATFRQRRVPRQLADDLVELADVAAQFSVVGPTLTEGVAMHHRHALLGPGFRSTLLEWKTASSLARTIDASIAWLPPSQSGPEFMALANGHEMEVECKHISHMITELLGDTEAANLAETVFASVRSRGLCGEVTVELSEPFTNFPEPDRLSALRTAFANAVAGPFRFDSTEGLMINGSLQMAGTTVVDPNAWQAQMRQYKRDDFRAYGQASAQGHDAADPIVIYMGAPRRTDAALLNHLWERKFQKAAEQCSGQHGAMLVFEWEQIVDPQTFLRSDGMQALLARTFSEYRHVAGILMRCDLALLRNGGLLDLSVRAYAARSEVTSFPEVAKLVRIESPIG